MNHLKTDVFLWLWLKSVFMAFEYYIYNTQTLIANRESISVFVANSKNGVSIKKFPVAGEVACKSHQTWWVQILDTYRLNDKKWRYCHFNNFLLKYWTLATSLELCLIPLIFNVHNVLRKGRFFKKWPILLKNSRFHGIGKRNRSLQNFHF